MRFEHIMNPLESGCFHHFANDSSALKRLNKFVLVHCNCVHGKKFCFIHMGLYFTSIDLGFCSWFSILVFALEFCSRFFPIYFSRLGRMFRVTAKVVGHCKSGRSRQKFLASIVILQTHNQRIIKRVFSRLRE